VTQLTTITQVIAIVVVVIALVIDWRTRKIPNLLTFPASAAGILLNYLDKGPDGALQAVTGWFVGAAITLFFIYLPIGPKYDDGEKIGMGDAKLMACMGAFLGTTTVLVAFFYFALCYGAISVFQLARLIPWKQVFNAFFAVALGGKLVAPQVDAEKLTEARKGRIPLGLAIALGTVIAMLFQKQTLTFLGFN
jgi:prepilin peptidase CpaA